MKAKFKFGFLTGFKDVPDAWPGQYHMIPILEPLRVMAGDMVPAPLDATPVKNLVFECRSIDQDKAAVFEFVEIR